MRIVLGILGAVVGFALMLTGLLVTVAVLFWLYFDGATPDGGSIKLATLLIFGASFLGARYGWVLAYRNAS